MDEDYYLFRCKSLMIALIVDVMENKRLSELIGYYDNFAEELAARWGWTRQVGSGSAKEYLDHLQWEMGESHMMLVHKLRVILQNSTQYKDIEFGLARVNPAKCLVLK